jgi:PknH-like extracellular domain
MRQPLAVLAFTAASMLVAACGGDNTGGTASSATTTTSKPPLAQAALANLLLPPADIDTALGLTGSKTDAPVDKLQEDSTTSPKGYTFPAECLYITRAALTPVYAGSGNTAVLGNHDTAPAPPGTSELESPDVDQFVVLFPSADQAKAFFATSTQRWPACNNRQDTVPGDADNPEIHWQAGSVNNTSGVLSTTAAISISGNGMSLSQSCQRALTVRNNVVIDVDACRKDPGDIAVTVANQIAGKADKQ